MPLRLKRTVGTAIAFHVKDRTLRLTLDGVGDSHDLFGLSGHHKFKRIRSTDGRSLVSGTRELIDLY